MASAEQHPEDVLAVSGSYEGHYYMNLCLSDSSCSCHPRKIPNPKPTAADTRRGTVQREGATTTLEMIEN
jgi:hypothetical protein